MQSLEIATASIFRCLLDPSRYKVAEGGRGSGKSHFFAGLLVECCLANPGTRAVCIREVQKTLKESAKLLIEDKIREFGATSLFRIKQDEIITPGNGVIIFKGMNDYTAATIKSLENFRIAWVEEGQTLSARSWELLRPTIRWEVWREKVLVAESEIWVSYNPANASDPIDKFFKFNPPKGAKIVKANWRDNPWFPSVLEDERQHDKQFNATRYEHIWEGDYEPAVEGAIWDRPLIDQYRVWDRPDLERIVVAIDPAVTSGEGADEHGVVVCGRGSNGVGYTLEDASCAGRPDRWARTAIACFDSWQADAIVIETNQGGEMCRSTLDAIRPGLPIIEVHASRGKHIRAEPISALYNLGKIRHVGSFPEMEAQMCQMTSSGFEGDGSPDRVDALVWGHTELFPQIVRPPRKSNVDTRAIDLGANGWMA